MATPKRNKTGKPSEMAPDNPGPAIEGSQVVLPEDELTDTDEFTDFFGDGEVDIKVELYRSSPQYWGGQQIDGFICRLMPGQDIQWIKENCGGGRYWIRKRIAGRFVDQRALRIAGMPKVESPPPPQAAPEAATRPDVTIDTPIGQIPIGGSSQEFIAIVERMAIIKAAFPPPPPPTDINAVLLQHILNGGKINLNEQLETINALTELGEKLGGKGGDQPDSIVGLLGKGLEAFTTLVQAQGGRKGPAPGTYPHPPALPRPTAAPIPIDGPVETRPEVNNIGGQETAQPPQKESETMNVKALASHAAVNIVQAYLSDPPKTEQETVDVLNFILDGITPEIKAQIKTFQPVLRNMAQMNYDGQIDPETPREEKEKFLLFFDNVFATFTA